MKLKSSEAFQQAYSSLNPQQKLAVDTLDGPVMVIAGPGTGKTQILATRIANILLKTDTNPYAILALTFTESAAKNMRERLIQLIGPTAYSVRVQTFHSFCEEVIRGNPECFPIGPESQVLADLERYELLQELLRNPKLTALRTLNSPYHYLKTIIKTISDLKREGVNEVRFAELVDQQKILFAETRAELKKTELSRVEKNLAKMEELSVIYTQYQQELSKRQRYDYDDMIAFVAEGFKREEELLLDYQEKLSYFLVDEYQDTNASQNTVVDLLASYWGEQANIFVVGDPHQSIYRFQGASLENTLNFLLRYPQARTITLEVGYRCPQRIYNVAAAVIQNNLNTDETSEQLSPVQTLLKELGKPLKSIHPDGPKVEIYQAISEPLETIFIAEEIKKLLAEHVPAEEIAVLYRNNADAMAVKNALEKWQIPFYTDDGNDALQIEEMQQFLNLLKVVADIRNSNEGSELFEVMNYSWVNMQPLVVMTIARAAGKTKMSIYDRVKSGYEEFCKLEFCKNVTAIEFAIVEDFLDKLAIWGQRDAEMAFPAWFEMVMKESNFLDWVMAHANRVQLLHHVNAVFRQVHALSMQGISMDLDHFLTALQTMRQHGIKIPVEDMMSQEKAVTLSTVHKAKGREWQYVFLIQCIDGKWGNSRSQAGLPLPEGILLNTLLGEKDRNEDDRRLFYVALTRAKQQMIVTYPESVVSGNKPKLTLGSIFITEIPELDKEKIDRPEIQEHSDEMLGKLVTMAPARQYKEQERKWLKEVVKDFHLSATALNNYLRSPQQFLARDILKIPEVKSPILAFGTAVHYAFEQLYKYVQQHHEQPSLEYVLAAFEKSLRFEILSKDEFELRLEYGRKVITDYLQNYADENCEPLIIEKFFGYGWNATRLDDIPLVGRVDRMDVIDPKEKTVRIIDYKTGRARTVNEIEGKVSTDEFSERELNLPEPVRGPYKRQLLFYKLLTQLDKSFTSTVTEGVFDFVEPDKDGRFVRRQFALLDKDVELLKDLIREVMQEIRTLKFLDQNES
jgi:DNA helicase-2/ATP-dependent DNA helicase PcrA